MHETKRSRKVDVQLEELLSQLAQRDPAAKAWHEALIKLNAFEVESAAVLATAAIGNGLDNGLVEYALSSINAVAVLNGIRGPGIEAMTIRAADTGYPELAFNAGNYLISQATAPDAFRQAEHYYQLAAEQSKDDATRAAAMVNRAAIVRDGSVSGQPDLPAALALYEQAAGLGLMAAMFNAGNVSLWLVDQGHMQYTGRAAKWLEMAIGTVDEGIPSVDQITEEVRMSLYGSARLRLAEMHARDLVPDASFSTCRTLIEPYLGKDPHAQWTLNIAHETQMCKAVLQPASTAGGNWKSVLEVMRWNVLSITPFDHGVVRGVAAKGDLLVIEAGPGSTMTLIVMDCFVHPQHESFAVMVDLAYGHLDELGHPCFITGNKGYFANVAGRDFSLLFHIVSADFTSVPIWPGATCSEVLTLSAQPEAERFIDAAADARNCIPILVNALDEGRTLAGDGLPAALWLGCGPFLRLPILSGMEPGRIGLQVSQSEQELEEIIDAQRRERIGLRH
ncbi:hypothetical protein [Pseudomonas baetica]|uniref:hypothetical protein n=1 Tax=Pseudomonas baetica TaxID=674054 RepID=UPI002406BA5A|nr:hypothetical protein [Pseudomonas baetica]MDF9779278.1 hypothetical protein [Pseudomonas baetica]